MSKETPDVSHLKDISDENLEKAFQQLMMLKKMRQKPLFARIKAKFQKQSVLSPEDLKKRNEEAEKEKRIAAIRLEQAELKRMWELFTNIESRIGNRRARKNFRRDFINDGTVMGEVIEWMIQMRDKQVAKIQEPAKPAEPQNKKVEESQPVHA